MAKWFSDSELQCHGEENYSYYGYNSGCGCGGANETTAQLQEGLDIIREAWGAPLYISCAYRCPVHNERVGGVWNSAHKRGMAADIIVPDGETVDSFADFIKGLFPNEQIGLGRYYPAGFVHFSRGAGEGEFIGG